MLTTEDAKCLALKRLLDRFGEEFLLQELQNIMTETSRTDNLVTVRFTNETADDTRFPFTVCVDCETGDTFTFNLP